MTKKLKSTSPGRLNLCVLICTGLHSSEVVSYESAVRIAERDGESLAVNATEYIITNLNTKKSKTFPLGTQRFSRGEIVFKEIVGVYRTTSIVHLNDMIHDARVVLKWKQDEADFCAANL